MPTKEPSNKDDRLDGQRANTERPNERNRENRPIRDEVDDKRQEFNRRLKK